MGSLDADPVFEIVEEEDRAEPDDEEPSPEED